jgi:uncharacterized RDD family membrane protein YckC
VTLDADAPARPAKITDRFLAYVLDIAPFGVGYYASLCLLINRFGVLPNTPMVWKHLFVAWMALYLAYQTVGNLSGATVGKRLFGVKVVSTSGGPPGFGRSLLRAFGYILSTPLLNLGFLWSLFQPESRTWHDLLSGTMVVESRPKSPLAALASAATALAVFAAILAGNVWLLRRPTPHDLEAAAKARQGLRVLASIEESYKRQHGEYTDSLAEIARASGDVRAFKEAMVRIFDEDGFVLDADRGSYSIRARARDRFRTRVEISSDKPQPR